MQGFVLGCQPPFLHVVYSTGAVRNKQKRKWRFERRAVDAVSTFPNVMSRNRCAPAGGGTWGVEPPPCRQQQMRPEAYMAKRRP